MLNFEQERWYREEYENVMNKGLIGKIWQHIHYQLDKPFLHLSNLEILEVGAGHGQHSNQTALDSKRYVEVDLQQLDTPASKGRKFNVERIIEDAQELNSFKDSTFDLLIATCLLPHLKDPELALNNFRRVVRDGGSLSLYVPCEPGILLRLARNVSTKRKRRKLGFSAESLHWREHRNHYLLIEALIRDIFVHDKVSKVNYPFSKLGWDLNLYSLYRITIQK
jgi:phosphatidylethanolamine/phosphatidyl-N-methylethanolamine N-methyltransferase